jgi:tetratricopeptide (TPR) repeat protein
MELRTAAGGAGRGVVVPERHGHGRPLTAAAVVLPAVLGGASAAWAQECRDAQGALRPAVARLVSIKGEVLVNGRPPVGTPPSAVVCPGDVVTVGPNSRAGLHLVEARTPLRLGENTVGRFQLPDEPESGLIDLARGALYFLSEVRRTLTVRTPYVTAGVEGTEVYLRVDEPGAAAPGAELIVLEGQVAVTPGSRTSALPPQTATTGERIEVGAGGELERTILPGGDGPYAVLRRVTVGQLSWTLFYPDVLVADEAQPFPRIRQAARLLAAGQVEEARALLGDVPDGAGREAALRDALLATVAFARKDAALANQLAERAAAAAPGTASALLASSYARQLALDLDSALAAAQDAAEASPRSPLPHARLAEIHLMRGETRAARAAARQATDRGGGPLAEIVLGYAELAALRGRRAEEAFRRALQQESWNPLALLGLGLAEIKQGRLADGTRQLENAAVHDPSSSLLRSYLGKAYFEQRRDEAAGKQYGIAKELDPGDPTPWLYNSIRLQLSNQPIQALKDLRQAVGLNDNRAPFRSRFLLDEDQSTLGVGIGRIYDDLGFQQLGIDQAAQALFIDPANAAAHRFLAELNRDEPRLQAATASELLQAQLLQPVGLNPVRPSLAFSDLNVVRRSGPAEVGFNEYTRLFQRDGVMVSGTGLVGTDATWSEEIVATGLYGRTSVSAGQFHYETDGFRPNSGQKHDVLSLFAQTQLSPDFSLQAEYRRRETNEDDRELRFDEDEFGLEAFDPDLHRKIEDDLFRVGAHWKIRPSTDFVLSAVHANRDRHINNEIRGGPTTTLTDSQTHTNQLEAQWIYMSRYGVFVMGAGGADSKIESEVTQVSPTSNFDFDPTTISAQGGYVFTEWHAAVARKADLTLRLGYDRTELEDTTTSGFTPGLGLHWRLTDKLSARAALSRTITRPTTVDQTLFPTQIAGFNQQYDEFEGTTADLLGLNVQYQLLPNLTLGVLGQRRWLSDEFSRTIEDEDEGINWFIRNETEDHVEIYANTTIGERLALTGGLAVDRYQQKWQEATNIPVRLTTLSVPFDIRYFAPSGLYTALRAEYLSQRQELSFNTNQLTGTDSDVLLDAEVGYRFGSGRGVVFLRGDNLLDRDLGYRDDLFRTPRSTQSPIGDAGRRFVPGRTVLVGLSITF